MRHERQSVKKLKHSTLDTPTFCAPKVILSELKPFTLWGKNPQNE